LTDEIIELGTRYGIVTPYTSYLATDGSYQAREMSVSSLPTNNRSAIQADMIQQSGRSAVAQSVQQNTLQNNASVTLDADEEFRVYLKDTKQNQFVGTKNFINDKGNWIDTEYKKDSKLPQVTIKFASNEFFDLVNKEKDLAKYLAIGKQVKVVWKNKVYQIIE
jgi:Ca-activated chloride channel family protein